MTILHTMGTYFTLWTAADIVEQKFISKKDKMDFYKSARMVAVGTFVVAPLVSSWMFLAEKRFPGKSLQTIIKKMLTDQFIFAPFAVSSFYVATCILERKNMKETFEEWKVKFPITYKTGICFWPFVQAINFKFVPYKHRPKLIGCASFVWSIFLCYEKEKHIKKNQLIEEEDGS